MDKIDLAILEKIINDEIKSQLDSGYKLNSEYVIILRNLLKKLNLKEYWDYDKKYGVLSPVLYSLSLHFRFLSYYRN